MWFPPPDCDCFEFVNQIYVACNSGISEKKWSKTNFSIKYVAQTTVQLQKNTINVDSVLKIVIFGRKLTWRLTSITRLKMALYVDRLFNEGFDWSKFWMSGMFNNFVKWNPFAEYIIRKLEVFFWQSAQHLVFLICIFAKRVHKFFPNLCKFLYS